MVNAINFSSDGRFEAKGTLGEDTQSIDETNIKDWFYFALKEFKEVFENYKKFLSDDGKISGDERNLLIKELDDFFNTLISLYIFITEDEDKTFEVEIPQYGFLIHFSVYKKIWTGYGNYPESFLIAPKDFNTFLKESLSPEFKNLVESFKGYSLEKTDNLKTTEIATSIKKLMFYILKSRFQIEKCMINS
jgi:hypothetical protein